MRVPVMHQHETESPAPRSNRIASWADGKSLFWPEALGLVNTAEISALRQSLGAGRVPPDLLQKIERLRVEDYREHDLQRQSRLVLSLLLAAEEGQFTRVSRWDRERLIRLMAYVRKDEDAIPDARPHGYDDDHGLMRATCAQMEPLLRAFKAWRLVRQVPELWLSQSPVLRSAVAVAPAQDFRPGSSPGDGPSVQI